jgi:hypothetical protein
MFVGAKFISPAILNRLILKGMRYVCRGEIHFARSPSNTSSSGVRPLPSIARIIAICAAHAPLGRDEFRPYIHDATHHGDGVREDADLLVTPYTARCAGYIAKTKMVSAKDTDFLPSASPSSKVSTLVV